MIARVSLEIALRKEFDYTIPPELQGRLAVGTRVKIPFGHREVFGVVTALPESTSQTNLRGILSVVSRQGLMTARVMELARWIGDYYCCAPEIAMKSVLPDAVRQEQAGWKERLYVRVAHRSGELPKLTKRQAELWQIIEEAKELPLQRLLAVSHSTNETVRRLEEKGLVIISAKIDERDPYAHEHILPSQSLELNAEQTQALATIKKSMDTGCNPRAFLLHGVTGSGKTEVYLQALAHALSKGQGGIVLVPEISLTPQTVERFKSRFSHGPLQTMVAVLHSHLSTGERHDEWHKIREGRARVVIGARSAIFAPVEPLGLVIVDEEHEHSYKQEEAPRYHARDVAVVRGQMENAVVVLGSATPSLESYYNVQRGKYGLIELKVRADDKKMPIVRVVDMRQTVRDDKGPPIFSQQLREAILQRLEKSEQTILFLNRRGFSTSLQCPLCGYVAECPNCSVSLTFHRHSQKLLCHICSYETQAPKVCPVETCRNPGIRYAGLGTERVEDTLMKLFPKARIQRMDSDSLKRKEDYRRILGDFRAGKIDILVGTQMIAKGLHFPNVTLVGIIHADLSLHIPDFRAGERTFQLLTQVAGRAGRGDVEGEVFVQSFTPFHPAIQYARHHDFIGFYEQEMDFRAQLQYPPLSRVALLTLKGRNEEKVRLSADHMKSELEKWLARGKADAGEKQDLLPGVDSQEPAPAAPAAAATAGFPDLVIAGPSPAPLARAETYYRYQLMLRTKQMLRLSRMLAEFSSKLALPEEVTLAIDIDPVNLA